MWLWYRQGIPDAKHENVVKLGRSLNGGRTWVTWTIKPGDFGWTNEWFDYPHMAVSNNFLYITTNMFNSTFVRMVLMKIPLAKLRKGSAISISYWTATSGWTWTPVQGATDRMYLGDNRNPGGVFRVFENKGWSNTLSWWDITIPAWTFTQKDGTCTVLNGKNPCARADQRITGGWVANNGTPWSEIGFFWNVKEGGGFAYPYVEAATFREGNKKYKGRPLIFHSEYAYHWAAISSNERGHKGAVVNLFAPSANPMVVGIIDDDFNGAPPGWEAHVIGTSAGGPSADTYGDYNRVRPFYPAGMAWAASAHTKNASQVSEPRCFIFGRERDRRSVDYWKSK
jgi:hypothetical protein